MLDLEEHLGTLGIVRDTGIGGARPLSLTGMALFVGVPAGIADLLPRAALVIGAIAIVALRRRPDRAFVVAVLTLVFGSPTVSINWFIYLLACLAPLVWPWTEPAVVAPSAGIPGGGADVRLRTREAGDG